MQHSLAWNHAGVSRFGASAAADLALGRVRNGDYPRLTFAQGKRMMRTAMKVEIPAIAFVRGFKVDHEPIMRFKDDWRPTWLIISQFERSLARPWKPRRAIDQVLDTSERVKK